VFDEADKHFDLLFNTIRAGRSLAASYNLQSDIQSTSRRQATLPLLTILYSFSTYTG
jgi:valyl-tRNA synthetase